jgi:hypothetical protein
VCDIPLWMRGTASASIRPKRKIVDRWACF